MSNHIYKNDFFNYVNLTSLHSAKYFLETVKFPFPIESVINIGCGKGAWLHQWLEYTQDIFGIDGHYVDIDTLFINHDKFKAVDLIKPIDLYKKFSLA